jgi:hypothetical protein
VRIYKKNFKPLLSLFCFLDTTRKPGGEPHLRP